MIQPGEPGEPDRQPADIQRGRRSSAANRACHGLREPGLVISAFEPVAVEAEYPAPRAEIAPDKTLGWVRRLLPLLWSRWRLFAASLGSSVANALIGPAMVLLVGHIIDHAIYPPE